MDKSLEQLDYKGIFRYFSEISKIPRGSGNEQEISDYLVSFAKEYQLEYTQDKVNNVIIIKEATPGYEKEPAIILQGHMDMVCEKKKENSHDFLKDEIKLIIDGDYIHAKDTTLGADNGIALAYGLALLADETLEHPRLEVIFTTDEEVGLKGAKAIDISNLQGKYMINLDSEEEGYLLCSCAGGLGGLSTLPLVRIAEFGKKVKVSLGGLKGGHSGIDIGKNRRNATKLLGRLLFDLRDQCNFGLIHMQGGFKDNVIPREAYAEILVFSENEKDPVEGYQKLKKSISEIMSRYQKELASSEPDLEYQIEEMELDTYKALHPVAFEKILFYLINVPYGVQVMSSDIEGLVESSINLGTFQLEDDRAVFCSSIRSSVDSYKHYLSNRLEYLISFLGGEYEIKGEYPGWEFKKDSPLREHCKKIYKEMYGKDMKVEAIHAGLECGLLFEQLPTLDIVSIGPDTFDVHTIEERVSIPSTIRVYQFLENVIKEKVR